MSSQDPGPIHRVSEPSSGRLDPVALQRRRALLSGLGKGSAVVAALSPMASQATRQHVLSNPALPNGMGYCTVSGFQSAAISGMPQNPTPCSAFAPSHFVITSKVDYVVGWGDEDSGEDDSDKDNSGKGNSGKGKSGSVRVKASDTRKRLDITSNDLTNLRANNNTGEIRVTCSNEYVIYKGNGSGDLLSCTKTTLTNLPDTALKSALFRSVFTASANTSARFLDLLVPAGGAALSDDAFFAAAYLSARLDGGGADQGDMPFDADYVVRMHGHDGAATFFRALCTKT